MARIDLKVPGDNSEVPFGVHLGDVVVMSFDSGPNKGSADIAVGSSGSVGFSAQLYANGKPLGRREGSVGTVDCHFGVGIDWLDWPRVEVNTPMTLEVTIVSTDPDARDPKNPAEGCSVNLHLPSPPKQNDNDTRPHRGFLQNLRNIWKKK